MKRLASLQLMTIALLLQVRTVSLLCLLVLVEQSKEHQQQVILITGMNKLYIPNGRRLDRKMR